MKYLYLILAALLMLCLAPMPYGYYQLVRFIALVLFTITYQDLPLGFVNNIGTRANNLYPKEWKIRNL